MGGVLSATICAYTTGNKNIRVRVNNDNQILGLTMDGQWRYLLVLEEKELQTGRVYRLGKLICRLRAVQSQLTPFV